MFLEYKFYCYSNIINTSDFVPSYKLALEIGLFCLIFTNANT